MIRLHRLNGSELFINCDHIETMEATPDTVIMLTNDRRYVVKETVDEIVLLIIAYKRSVYTNSLP